ncbi:MAG: sigma-70 family RNA polymerase sigma factor [Planctomycetota bacterium]
MPEPPNEVQKLHAKIEELVKRAQQGDKDALVGLYCLYQARLRREAHNKMGADLRGETESIDILQSVWRGVLKGIAHFEYRGPDSFFRWLEAQLENKVRLKGRYYSAAKRDSRRAPDVLAELEGKLEPVSAGPTPSQLAVNREDLDRLSAIVSQLSQLERQVLGLRLREGMSYEEIGTRIGRSAEGARKLFGRILVKLKGLMEQGAQGGIASR